MIIYSINIIYKEGLIYIMNGILSNNNHNYLTHIYYLINIKE